MVTTSEVRWWGDTWAVSASFGGSTIQMGDTTDSILDRAEKSLAESVAGGGNRVTVAA